MKTTIFFVLFIFAIGSAHADPVTDVKVLDVKYAKNSFEVKLQTKDGPKDSYFLVDIVKDDEKAFEKIALIWKKLKHKSFKLNLNIPSFSATPSGSYYRSKDVQFEGSVDGESLISK